MLSLYDQESDEREYRARIGQVRCPICNGEFRGCELDEHMRESHGISKYEDYIERVYDGNEPEWRTARRRKAERKLSMPTTTNYRDCEIKISQHPDVNTYNAEIYTPACKIITVYYGSRTDAANEARAFIDRLTAHTEGDPGKAFAVQLARENASNREIMLHSFVDCLIAGVLEEQDNSTALATITELERIASMALIFWDQK